MAESDPSEPGALGESGSICFMAPWNAWNALSHHQKQTMAGGIRNMITQCDEVAHIVHEEAI